MEAVIDTNALVYDYVENSEFHVEARKALDGLDRMVVPTVVLEEFVFVMKRAGLEDSRLGHKVVELLEDRRIETFPILARDIKNAASILLSERATFFRFNDKLVLSAARRRRLPLLTFDRELKSESKRVGVRVLP